MKICLISIFLISLTNTVRCGYLTGHHPLPPNVISSRTIIGGAVGGPPSGAYSSSQLTQTVSTSPTQVQSSISTHHPSQHGYNRGNQGPGYIQVSRYNQGQFSNQGQNQGYGQNQGHNYNGYNTNIPNVIAYGSYDHSNQDQGSQYQSNSQGQSQGNNGQGGSYQNPGGYYRIQSQQYGYNGVHGTNSYGRF
ncbi:unnamed protein product [Psylliodes chrysocephalus]|uniref:Uncharacterized protein n=1 Tax=Psylliodes chrysocephalus TaxID=3402493 RepID=A0A9P0CXQ4_9CUCU|nr:unnamed protein product [Psylliodes chrysocephala]